MNDWNIQQRRLILGLEVWVQTYTVQSWKMTFGPSHVPVNERGRACKARLVCVRGDVPAVAVIPRRSLVGLHSRLDLGCGSNMQQPAGVGAVIATTRMLCSCSFAALHGKSAFYGVD